jgi:acyl-CoA reductase-like NAD-dependent aldehyde dehydrogenase
MGYDYKILIDGKLTKPAKNATMQVINPANNTVAAVVPKCSEIDVNLAVEAANKAKAKWKSTYIGDRSDLLFKLAAIIREPSGRACAAGNNAVRRPGQQNQQNSISRCTRGA